MSIITGLRLSRSPAAGLAIVGIAWGGMAGLVPDIKAQVGASDAQLGVAGAVSALGAMASMYLAPRIGGRLGRRGLPFLGAALALVLLLPALAGTPEQLMAAYFMMGLSVSQLDINANVRIGALEQEHGRHLQNVNHAMFSFAFAATALTTGLLRKAGWSPPEIALVLCGAALAVSLVLIDGTGPLAQKDADESDSRDRATPWRVIGLVAVILFTSFIGENATEAWSAIHIERTFHQVAGEGAFGPTILGLTMGLGRLSGQLAAEKFGEERLVIVSGALGVIGALIVAAAPNKDVVLLGVAILGLGMAVIVPSANSILGKRVRKEQLSHALSRAWMAGMLGFFIGPALMGGLSELFGLRVSFAVIGVLIAAVIPAVLALRKR